MSDCHAQHRPVHNGRMLLAHSACRRTGLPPPCACFCAVPAVDAPACPQLRNYALSRLSQSYSRSAAEAAAAEFCALKMLMIQQLKAESQHAILRADIRQACPLTQPLRVPPRLRPPAVFALVFR